MRGFLQKAKAELKGVIQQQDSGANYPGSPPTNYAGNQHANQIGNPSPEDIIRYRYHHGTNVGSVFVIERWLQSSRFPDGAEGSSELACVKAWVDRIGIDATRQKFEEQWLALTDDDINYLRHANCTTIRLPIGYFDLPGEEFTRGTPFEPYAGVYAAAWPKIEDLIRRLRWSGIGVLVDLHALPGGANGQEHSGTNSGKAELWTSPFNRALGVRCGQFLAQSAPHGLLAGIQLVNEAEWDAPGMYEWYDECITAISAVDPSIPVIISDGWNLDRAIDYTLQKNRVEADRVAPVVIDTHYYWAFTDEDKQKSPQQITEEARHKLSNLDGKEGSVIDRGAVQVIVGEYSCVMTEDSWAKLGNMSREEGVRNFGNAQSQRWQQRSGGSFFWTYKMDWMPGGEWGFKAQTDLGSITPPKLATRSRQELQALFDKARGEQDWRGREALNQHVNYWNGVDPGGYYEHDKYEFGWKVGYQDATAFFWGLGSVAGSTNDGPYGARIGMLEVWILKRIRESGFRGGFTWEFEQGLRRGVQDFYSAVEV